MLQDQFVNRHIGPRADEMDEMLKVAGVSSLDALIDQTVPSDIRLKEPLKLSEGLSEHLYFKRFLALHGKTKFSLPISAWGIMEQSLPP